MSTHLTGNKHPDDITDWYFDQLVKEARQSFTCLQAVYNRLVRWGAKETAERVLKTVETQYFK